MKLLTHDLRLSHMLVFLLCVCVVGGHHLHQPQLGERLLSTAHVATSKERA